MNMSANELRNGFVNRVIGLCVCAVVFVASAAVIGFVEGAVVFVMPFMVLPAIIVSGLMGHWLYENRSYIREARRSR